MFSESWDFSEVCEFWTQINKRNQRTHRTYWTHRSHRTCLGYIYSPVLREALFLDYFQPHLVKHFHIQPMLGIFYFRGYNIGCEFFFLPSFNQSQLLSESFPLSYQLNFLSFLDCFSAVSLRHLSWLYHLCCLYCKSIIALLRHFLHLLCNSVCLF